MARIRTIKPEICTSEQFVECSPTARLLFVLLWGFCDDAGVHPDSIKRIKMEVFPGDSFTEDDVAGFVDELVTNGLLVRFEADNKAFLAVTGWHHQKIDKPNYKYPPCPIPREIDDHSTSYRRYLDDHSTNGRRYLDDHSTNGREESPAEWNGMEWKGEESTGNTFCPEPVEDARSPGPEETADDSPVVLVFDCNGPRKRWDLRQSRLDKYAELFPGVDCLREIRKAKQWLDDNPSRRKTASGMPRFLTGWLERVNNRSPPPVAQSQASQRTYLED